MNMPQLKMLAIGYTLLFVATRGWAVETNAAAVPRFGLWYTAWWTADDQFHHWQNCHRLPARGRYTAGDPAIIKSHYAAFRDLGVDFLIMDDTNGVGNDGNRINDNIRAWFDFMDAQPVANRIPICIGGGGEMRSGGKAAQQHAADLYWQMWAQRPSYFKLNGKPLVLVDTDKNYGPGDWNDPRFAVRWAYNGDNHAAMARNQAWGWGSYAPAPALSECISIWPGHRFPRNVAEQGKDPIEAAREGGSLYVREWLRVLKAHPQYVTVADWNCFEEETAIEESYSWEDVHGYCVPDLYIRITRAYSRLRNGKFVQGECYRSENQPEVYLYDGGKLVHQTGMPHRAAIILVPDGMFAEMKAKLANSYPRSEWHSSRIPPSCRHNTSLAELAFRRENRPSYFETPAVASDGIVGGLTTAGSWFQNN